MLRPFLLVPAALLLAACNDQGRLPDEASIAPARGAALFAEGCASCHGADGTGGQGPDLTGITAAAGGTFPRDRVMAQIDGLGRHGDPDAVMPEFGAAGMGNTVIVEENGIGTPVPADLLALANYLETLQR
ncbi:c-type cytochrome [Jannaschia rubra]|uniref:Cytochrome c oxidase, cbb3-type, subunit III n=1 Tax=Jannaschia rubra TaxID=282197 RepID=A0A0M6XWX2_9RHOB|nr:cytochrome c [Jannaschia rubra]CTQ34781.1 cytochrome c oxidase, cbb3-type, subunit III [Jannaschia rubra]SFG69890.1 Cytochrome c [Jannaschia rubra]